MVIRAAEPVVVDTGMAENRDQYLADVFCLVEPDDVRWVFISHDDVDHTGNVNALMDACANATLIINWFMTERMGASLAVPPTRQRWIGDGESFDVGDRMLHAVRPPVFDSPTTRGLFDPTTGVYWASDSFATPMLTGRSATWPRSTTSFWIDGMHHVRPLRQPVARAGRRREVPGRPSTGSAALRPDDDRRLPHARHPRRPRRPGHRRPPARRPPRSCRPQPDQAVLEQIQRVAQRRRLTQHRASAGGTRTIGANAAKLPPCRATRSRPSSPVAEGSTSTHRSARSRLELAMHRSRWRSRSPTR